MVTCMLVIPTLVGVDLLARLVNLISNSQVSVKALSLQTKWLLPEKKKKDTGGFSLASTLSLHLHLLLLNLIFFEEDGNKNGQVASCSGRRLRQEDLLDPGTWVRLGNIVRVSCLTRREKENKFKFLFFLWRSVSFSSIKKKLVRSLYLLNFSVNLKLL